MTTVREEDRQMILAHVLCGREFDYKATLDKGLKRPPYLPGTSRLYDSVKGGPHSGAIIHVVYTNAHSYPSYVITYNRRTAASK